MIIFRKIFEMIDVNNDGTVDFNELLVVIVLASRLNDLGSRLAFVFDMLVNKFEENSFVLLRLFLGGMFQEMDRLIEKN